MPNPEVIKGSGVTVGISEAPKLTVVGVNQVPEMRPVVGPKLAIGESVKIPVVDAKPATSAARERTPTSSKGI